MQKERESEEGKDKRYGETEREEGLVKEEYKLIEVALFIKTLNFQIRIFKTN